MKAAGDPVQRRILSALVAGQILGGLGFGATVSTGALLAVDVSGSDAWSGIAATASTLGAAVAALPLARIAARRGRRWSLRLGALTSGLGAVVVVLAARADLFPALLAGLVMVGVGQAVNLQSRFAATDLAAPGRRGRDLSLVVWATTIGAVGGPNLVQPGEAFSRLLGVPELAGPFLFTIAAQVLVIATYTAFLRPDPLLTAVARARDTPPAPPGAGAARHRATVIYGIAVLGFSHATMVAVMAVTPVHMSHHGADLAIIGITISLHVAGMYGLSPLFGFLADRVGRITVILLGQVVFAAALLTVIVVPDEIGGVMLALVLLGLGWSAATVGAAALVAEAAPPDAVTRIQGRADLVMSGAGMLGGIAAGLLLAVIGYSGLGLVAGLVVLVASGWSLIAIVRGRLAD